MEVPVLNKQGKSVGVLTIDESSLGGEVNPALIKQAYVRYHANRRQGSSRTKSRGMVEGSTRKLYRQKGTGNARVGPARVPNRKGGGHAFAKSKRREEYRLDMPMKMRRQANRNALLAKLIDQEVKVIDDLSLTTPRTRDVRDMLGALGVDRTCLVVVGEGNENLKLGAQNLAEVSTVTTEGMTCFEMLNHRFVVIAKSDLEAWLNGASARTGKDAKHITRGVKSKEAA